MQADTVLCANDDVVAREVGGELVLLNLGSGTYFGLNTVGGHIWQLLEAGDQTIAALCDAVEAEFDVDRETVERDVAVLAAQLVENGLAASSAG